MDAGADVADGRDKPASGRRAGRAATPATWLRPFPPGRPRSGRSSPSGLTIDNPRGGIERRVVSTEFTLLGVTCRRLERRPPRRRRRSPHTPERSRALRPLPVCETARSTHSRARGGRYRAEREGGPGLDVGRASPPGIHEPARSSRCRSKRRGRFSCWRRSAWRSGDDVRRAYPAGIDRRRTEARGTAMRACRWWRIGFGGKAFRSRGATATRRLCSARTMAMCGR